MSDEKMSDEKINNDDAVSNSFPSASPNDGDFELTDFNMEIDEIAKTNKKSRKYAKSFYTIELVGVTTSIAAINKFILLHPEFFKTNINKKIVHFSDNQIYSLYTEPLWFKDTIHKINGYITTEYDFNTISMKIHINKNLKNKECYVKQIENYVNYQTKYGNNVELNYYKILSDTIIKHCYYNEPIEQWNKDVILVQNEFFSPHKQYLFSIINNKVKNNGVGNTANSWNNLILHGIPGSGKCLKINTPVTMYDGTIKKIQDIGVGELVLGDDFTPRKVLQLSSGEEELFEITHSGGDSYTVNGNHVLSLIYSKSIELESCYCYVDVPIKEYINFSESSKSEFYGYRIKSSHINNFFKTGGIPNDKIIQIESIKVKSVGKDKYYGFELDGNHRFVLGNHIVTHNSSCIYRISMMLKLSIISVDISLYLNKKKELYSLFHGQEFSLPSNNNKESAISNAIIVLEEFDHAMDKLLDIENIFKYKDVIKREYLNMKNKEIKTRTMELVDEYEKRTVDEKNHSDDFAKKLANLKEASNRGEISYDNFVEMEMLNDGFDMQNNKVHDKARQNILKKRDFDNEICGINAELNNIIKSMDEDNKSNILRLSDMLELFQGPVPVKNRIVMATTNNFEKIKNALPALFRSGRMSPIHFDYLDWESLNNLCLYYFEQKLTCEPQKVTIPTSQIIELAIKHVLTKKKFEEFQEELLLLFNANLTI